MKRIAVSLLCALMLPLAAPVSAAPVEDPAGLEQLRRAALAGDADAMLELGILYEYGYRMRDKKAPALAWYRMAREAGNTKAEARLEALKGSMSAQELEESNKLYGEYAAARTAPPATPPPVTTTPTPEPKPETESPAPLAK